MIYNYLIGPRSPQDFQDSENAIPAAAQAAQETMQGIVSKAKEPRSPLKLLNGTSPQKIAQHGSPHEKLSRSWHQVEEQDPTHQEGLVQKVKHARHRVAPNENGPTQTLEVSFLSTSSSEEEITLQVAAAPSEENVVAAQPLVPDAPMPVSSEAAQTDPVAVQKRVRLLWKENPAKGERFAADQVYKNNPNVPFLLGMGVEFREEYLKKRSMAPEDAAETAAKIQQLVATPTLFYAAIAAARRVKVGLCYCVSQGCGADCVALTALFATAESQIKPLTDRILEAAYGTSNDQAIQAMRQKEKIP